MQHLDFGSLTDVGLSPQTNEHDDENNYAVYNVYFIIGWTYYYLIELFRLY
jgi:hypothetical protein